MAHVELDLDLALRMGLVRLTCDFKMADGEECGRVMRPPDEDDFIWCESEYHDDGSGPAAQLRDEHIVIGDVG